MGSQLPWLPTDLDTIQEGLGITFDALPVELRIKIAASLERSDLPNLARVCQNLRDIARQQLYEKITMGAIPTDEDDLQYPRQLFFLHRTLTEGPKVAVLIKHLKLIVGEQNFPSGRHYYHTVAESTSVDETYIPEALIIGHILLHAPSLQTLSIKLMRSNYSWTPDSNRLLAPSHLFGPTTTSTTLPTLLHTNVPSLKSLNWEAADFHWSLAQFPHLSSLTLGRGCKLLPDAAPSETSRSITHLHLHCVPGALKAHSQRYEHMQAFLAHIPHLQSLETSIHFTSWSQLEFAEDDLSQSQMGHFAHLMDRLGPIYHCVTDFTIASDNSWGSGLDYVYPILSIAQFINLKTLRVPYEFLPARDEHFEDRGIGGILPPRLRTLVVVGPRVDVYGLLGLLLRGEGMMRELKRVELVCEGVYGEFEEMVREGRRVREGLWEIGVEVVVREVWGDDWV